jgi:hypothetical protein
MRSIPIRDSSKERAIPVRTVATEGIKRLCLVVVKLVANVRILELENPEALTFVWRAECAEGHGAPFAEASGTHVFRS